MEQKRLKPWVGVLFLGIVLAMAQFVCFPIQRVLGLWGLAITELILLVMAIAAALICKQNLKEVFPVKLPKIREVLGVLIFWVGGILATYMATYIFMLFFPEEMAAVSGGLNDIVSSEGLLLGILIASVMPAICEEAVHRGFILHTFKGIKKPWVIVLSMGILFGVFHLDFYRFIPTAILGACITWVMLKTENMLMPALYHGTNNLVPVLLSVALQDTVASVTSETAEGQGAMIAEQLLQGGVPLEIPQI